MEVPQAAPYHRFVQVSPLTIDALCPSFAAKTSPGPLFYLSRFQAAPSLCASEDKQEKEEWRAPRLSLL